MQESAFEWEFYRGLTPKRMVAIIPTQRADEVISFVEGLTAGETFLTFEGPDRPGDNPGTATREVQGVFIERVVKLNPLQTQIVMYDRRLQLARRIMDKDFNLIFGDGFLEGTREPTYSAAIRKVAASIDILANHLAPNAFGLIPQRAYQNADLLAGFPLGVTFAQLLDAANVDLTVTKESKFRFVDRKDIREAGRLPGPEVDWWQRPTWVDADNVTLTQLPQELHALYKERHCLRMANAEPAKTAIGGKPELQVELEQVYAARGSYFDLQGLLLEFGFNAFAITDRIIASAIMTDTMQGTGVEADGTAETSELIKALKDGWRVLWRIVFPASRGHIGGWTDWDFGKLDADGAVRPVPVECKWVEFLNFIDTDAAGGFIGSKASHNNARGEAPFAAQWDNGPENRVIRLKQQELRDGNLAMPGELANPLVVVQQNSVTDKTAFTEFMKNGFRVIESEDRQKAQFLPAFELAIFLVATKRLPNDETRYHLQKVAAVGAGQVDFYELPVTDDILAYRDFVQTGVAGHAARGDGLGPLLNADALKADAERRTILWLQTYTAPIEGEGIGERLDLLDFEVEGAISMIRIERDGPKIRTRIAIGNLTDAKARERVADKRRIQNERREAGKRVV